MKNQSFDLNSQTLNHQTEKSTVPERARARREPNMKANSCLSLITLSVVVLSFAFGIGGAAIPATAALAAGVPTPISTPTPCNTLPGSRCGITMGPITFFGAIAPTLTIGTSSFSGKWSSPAAAAWQGTFTGTGIYPYGAIGDSNWSFAGLQASTLPAGTYFGFGDLDFGSGTDERFFLQALDSGGNPIQMPWLNDTSYCSNSSVSVTCDLANPPEYVWGGSTGAIGGDGSAVPASTYEFDGYNVLGNPNLWYWVNSNMPIDGLMVSSFSTFDGMAVAAPTPEPGSLLLLGSGVLGLGGLLRRRLLG